MKLDRNKLYSILLIACLAGYIWLYYSITNYTTDNKSSEVCIIKQLTNIPCPSCGSTRAINALIKGDLMGALKLNPLGYIVALIMLIAPIWIITDLIMKRKTFFDSYQKIETNLKKPSYAIPLIIVVIINWMWNIAKGL